MLWYKLVCFSRNTYTKKYGNGVKYRNLDFIILPFYMFFFLFWEFILMSGRDGTSLHKTLGTVARHLRTPDPEIAPIR